MEVYRCDRCGVIIEKEERCAAHLDGSIVDLCSACHTAFKRDIQLMEKHYLRNKEAIKRIYGMRTYEELLGGKKHEKN